MKSKTNYVEHDVTNEPKNQNREESEESELSIGEQIEIYAELIVDQLIKELNEK